MATGRRNSIEAALTIRPSLRGQGGSGCELAVTVPRPADIFGYTPCARVGERGEAQAPIGERPNAHCARHDPRAKGLSGRTRGFSVRRSPPTCTARVTVLWHTAIAWTPRVPVAECSKLYQSHLYALRSVSYRLEDWSNAPMTLMSALMSAWRNAPAMRSSRCGQNKRVRHSPLAHAHLEHMQKPGGPSCSSPSCSSSSSSSSPLNSSVSSCILSIGANRPPPS